MNSQDSAGWTGWPSVWGGGGFHPFALR